MLNEQTAPPMKTITVGDHKMGGETVLYRHEKTLVNKNLFAVAISTDMSEAEVDAKLAEMAKVDYERIGDFLARKDSGDLKTGIKLSGHVLETMDCAVDFSLCKSLFYGCNKDPLVAGSGSGIDLVQGNIRALVSGSVNNAQLVLQIGAVCQHGVDRQLRLSQGKFTAAGTDDQGVLHASYFIGKRTLCKPRVGVASPSGYCITIRRP